MLGNLCSLARSVRLRDRTDGRSDRDRDIIEEINQFMMSYLSCICQ